MWKADYSFQQEPLVNGSRTLKFYTMLYQSGSVELKTCASHGYHSFSLILQGYSQVSRSFFMPKILTIDANPCHSLMDLIVEYY